MMWEKAEEISVKSKFNFFAMFMYKPIESPDTKMDFLQNLVQSFSMTLVTPEEEIIRQGDMNSNLYFISTGDCAVNIRDHKNV
jgi:CRP-like cAMP-binding protein